MTHTLTYRIHEVAPYINWIYFFHAWGFPPRFAAISRIHGCDACRAGWLAEFPEEERARAAEAMQLFKDANRMLAQLDGDFHTHVRFASPCCANNTPRNRTSLIFAFRISYVRCRKAYPTP